MRAGGEGGERRLDGWMASLTHRQEFKQTQGDSEGQGSLTCCSSWSHRVRNDLATEQQQQVMLLRTSMSKFVDTDQWKGVVYLYHGMLFNSKKEQATDTYSINDEFPTQGLK